MHNNLRDNNLDTKIDQNIPIIMRHYIANTGQLTITNRSEVSDDVIKQLLPIIRKGDGFVPIMPEIYIKIQRGLLSNFDDNGYSFFSIASDKTNNNNWAIGFGCWNQKISLKLWMSSHFIACDYLEKGLGTKNRLPVEVPETPWMSVIRLPASGKTFSKYGNKLSDLERSLFWTLVESEK